MYEAFKYSVRVWLTGVLLSPAIIAVFGIIPRNNFDNIVFIFFFGTIFGLVLSIPSFLLLLSLTAIIVKRDFKPWYKKIILSFTGIALTLLAFYLYQQNRMLHGENLQFAIVYALVIIAGIWYYKFQGIAADQISWNQPV